MLLPVIHHDWHNVGNGAVCVACVAGDIQLAVGYLCGCELYALVCVQCRHLLVDIQTRKRAPQRRELYGKSGMCQVRLRRGLNTRST